MTAWVVSYRKWSECMNYLIDGPGDARITLALAHGAGAAMDTPFMDRIATGVAEAGIRVVRFEFPYMEKRRTAGRRAGPDRPQVLMETWQAVITELGPPERLVIGGKSMGGRIASMVADDAGVAGLVCLGYPFHPAGKPDRLRTGHLKQLRTPGLIIQGTRDPLGRREEIEDYKLSESISVAYLEDGEHSFRPRKASGHTLEQHLETAVDEIVGFAKSVVP
jgi:predicted alpha/beta-hydrolase family hydrolase